MRPKAPTTEAEYLAEFGYAPDSAVGKLGFRLYSATTDLERLQAGSQIGWTLPKTPQEAEALAAFQRSIDRIMSRRAAA